MKYVDIPQIKRNTRKSPSISSADSFANLIKKIFTNYLRFDIYLWYIRTCLLTPHKENMLYKYVSILFKYIVYMVLSIRMVINKYSILFNRQTCRQIFIVISSDNMFDLSFSYLFAEFVCYPMKINSTLWYAYMYNVFWPVPIK